MAEITTERCPECGTRDVVEMNDYWSDKYSCYVTEMVCHGCMHQWRVKF